MREGCFFDIYFVWAFFVFPWDLEKKGKMGELRGTDKFSQSCKADLAFTQVGV